MKLLFTGRHFEISTHLKDVIKQKLSKIKYFQNRIIDFHITIEKIKLEYKIEINFNADGRKFFIEEKASTTVFEALDKLIDKLERLVRKHKEKIKDHKRGSKGFRALEEE
ncbi:MAG: ribosome-associated translation inhibitor RaiA [Spirochaetes bacterium]|nr:ribosome-associated translation inhibitor RaiA [Spirochaetota bacterium]